VTAARAFVVALGVVFAPLFVLGFVTYWTAFIVVAGWRLASAMCDAVVERL